MIILFAVEILQTLEMAGLRPELFEQFQAHMNKEQELREVSIFQLYI